MSRWGRHKKFDRAPGVPIPPAAPPEPPVLLPPASQTGPKPQDWYDWGGRLDAQDVLGAVERHGGSLGRVLDMGLSWGRVARQVMTLAAPGRLVGISTDRDMVRWTIDNVPVPADKEIDLSFVKIPTGKATWPSLGSADVAYMVDHIGTCDRFAAADIFWRLGYLIRSGGLLIFTCPGESAVGDRGVAWLRAGGHIEVAGTYLYGSKVILGLLGRRWDVVEFRPAGSRGSALQDFWVARRK